MLFGILNLNILSAYSRLDYQARPHVAGASAFRHLVAKLPPRAHSIYYRDEIGNISTSNLWGDPTKVQARLIQRIPILFTHLHTFSF